MGMRALKLKLGNHRAPNDPVTSTKKLKDIKIEREGWRIFGLKETEGIWQSVAIYCPQWDFESDKDTVKRKEQIPQRLGVCCVPTAVLTAGATMWTKETQFLPSRSARSGEGTHNAQAEMHGHSAVMGIHKQETLREDTKAFIQTSLSEKASLKR